MLALESVRVRTEGRIARIVLERPPLNVMNIAMMREINAVIEELGPEMDFLVFQGAGEKGFSAGAEVTDHTPERVEDMLRAFHGIFREIWSSRFITIAAVHGYCLGGGCELATFCDFVIATESAKFGQPEIKLGCFPPMAMVTFPRLIGMRAAVDLILSGRTISAREGVNRQASQKNEGLSAEIQRLRAQLRSQGDDRERAQRELEKLCGEADQLRAGRDSLRQQLAALGGKLDAQTAQIESLERRAVGAEMRLDATLKRRTVAEKNVTKGNQPDPSSDQAPASQ